MIFFFFFSSRRRHTRCSRDWSSDVCSSDLERRDGAEVRQRLHHRQGGAGDERGPRQRQDHGDERARSEEHTSELQSRLHLVCRLLLEKKKTRATGRRELCKEDTRLGTLSYD